VSEQSGLSNLAHEPDPDAVQDRYDQWVSTYEDDVRSWGYEVPEALAARLARHLAPGVERPILDAGCGTGLVGRALRSHPQLAKRRIIGIDASPQSLAALPAGLYAETREVDLGGDLPFSPASFDAVVCGGVLTYLPNTLSVLSNFGAAIAADGVVIATQRTDLWASRSCGDVMSTLRNQGWRVEVSEPQPYLPGHPEYADDIQVIYVTMTAA